MKRFKRNPKKVTDNMEFGKNKTEFEKKNIHRALKIRILLNI